MIERMNLVCIVAEEKDREGMLTALRNLGVLHISEKRSADESVSERFSTLQKLSNLLGDYAAKEPPAPGVLSDEEFEKLFEATVAAIDRKKALDEARSSKLLEIERIRPWGCFVPEQVRGLASSGCELHFYRIDKRELKKLAADEKVKYIRLSAVDKTDAIAVIGEGLSADISANEFIIPEKGIGQLEAEIKACEAEAAELEKLLHYSALQVESYKAQLIKTQNDVEYSAVRNTTDSEYGLVWLSGYIPVDDTERFKACAAENHWAYQYETVEEDDGKVPTKVKYTKVTALMKPVFDMLGTVPGYGEYDISFWFLAFFTLFFAMIIGDAGYGLIFLAAAIALAVKFKGFNNAILLLTVLSVGTVAWGAVTGTWFGAEKAMEVPFLRALVIPSFANYPEYFGLESATVQNSVMKFCFSIGVIQLALACIMNIRRKLTAKDLSFVADLGWLVSISALYFMVLYLVVGQKVNIKAVAVAIGGGFLLVVLFGGMSPDKSFIKGMLAGVGGIFTTFLDTISAFGNVMSYIRLFAVGMASLAIAQSFNNMASGFSGALVVVGVVIVIIGHLLNIVMGFLSVVVHGVRLNLLEFSGQLGMEWTGTAYEPFSKSKTLKK